ncbi:MAG: hypothetical protein OIN88_04230 [Candidatus Methanoperedens sp.]|nr:hypothetical protein [Candidatus Methanoperedens sp.]
MPVLSIIACGMLEDELAYVLSEDNELAELILVENREHFGLQRKLRSRGCLPALIPLDRIPEILKREKNHSFLEIMKPLWRFHFIEKISRKLENRCTGISGKCPVFQTGFLFSMAHAGIRLETLKSILKVSDASLIS